MDMSTIVFLIIGLVAGFALSTKLKSTPSRPLDPAERAAFLAKASAMGIDTAVAAQLPDKKIEAIKIYRTQSGKGLKQSKEQIDAWCRELGC
ncbi:MAG: hypothetical protein KGS72_22360 [Cyanobacteria bacterium REEB67]|nr:hypothetical protein [Cyanobacteria bacterium REEB67]